MEVAQLLCSTFLMTPVTHSSLILSPPFASIHKALTFPFYKLVVFQAVEQLWPGNFYCSIPYIKRLGYFFSSLSTGLSLLIDKMYYQSNLILSNQFLPNKVGLSSFIITNGNSSLCALYSTVTVKSLSKSTSSPDNFLTPFLPSLATVISVFCKGILV